jgi:hypothetical protein
MTRSLAMLIQKPFLLPAIAIFILLIASVSQADQMGISVVGSTEGQWGSRYSHGDVYTAATSFTAQYMCCYIWSASGSNGRAAIYASSSGSPTTLLSDSNLVPLTNDQWYVFTLSSPVSIVAGQEYFISIASDNTDGYKYNSSSTTNTYYQLLDAALTYPATYSPTTYTQDPLSLYITDSAPTATPTYTLTSTHSPTMTHSPTVTPTITPTSTITQTFTPTHTPTTTPTNTHSPTGTITQTYTITMTSTHSPTATITPTITLTVTATPTLSPSVTSTIAPFQPGKDAYVTYPSPAKGNFMYFYFYTEGSAQTTIKVWNVIGECADTIDNIFTTGGYQRINWPLKGVAPGIYLYRITVEDENGLRKSPIKKFVVVI